ncbi:uncharacterized protein LOC142519627 [Primulina tabacum]|uniref:uncharacterized protein LOC142519627 n=1 Tax=Primulina tabacum TaxID=48773 RepID=UPI003F5A82C6
MEIFNKALLAKQIWRILRKPDSLVGRVLKARYFKHGDIMHATLGSNPSFVWRSLLWSRTLPEEGLYWRVGNGSSIRIFRDKWVPKFRSYLTNHGSPNLNELKVDTLIHNGNWDEEAIRGSNLIKHHVPALNVCPLCGFGGDTMAHALFYCPEVKGYWKGQIHKQPLNQVCGRDTMEICNWMMSQLSKDDFESYIEELWALGKASQTSNPEPAAELIKVWTPTPSQHLRLDVDAAVNDHLNIYGIAGVIRNQDGNMMLAFGNRIEPPISVVHAEMLAIQEGIKHVYQRGLVCTHVYSDSQMAVQAVMDPSSDLGYIGSCAEEIKNLTKKPWILSLQHI